MKKGIRNSNIELVKIIAIFMIIISHVTQTLGTGNILIDFQDYVFPLGIASNNIQTIILNLFFQGGALGNTLFFSCSAWFLVGNTAFARRKAFSLLCTVWTISIFILSVYFFCSPSCLTSSNITVQLLPTCYANCWYMTCYIIFLFIYPWMNKLIDELNQKELLRIMLFSSFLWIMMNYFKPDWFFSSSLITWVSIYVLIAYLKVYCTDLMKNKKIGLLLLMIGIIGYILQVTLVNYIALNINSIFWNKVLYLNNICSPFYLMIAIGSIIIASKTNGSNKHINYISGLSIYVYLFHENYLFRCYTRPKIWQYIYMYIGYEHIVLLTVIYAFGLFILTCSIAAFYKETIQKLVNIVSNSLYLRISKIYHLIETKIIRIK